MHRDRIECIYNYCDRWCERCPFTQRCSLFATQAGIAMCGDVAAGIELAVGPFPETGTPGPSSDWAADETDLEIIPQEVADFIRQEQDRTARINNHSIMQVAEAFATLAERWLSARYERVRSTPDDVLKEALDIALHDASLI